MLYLQFLADVKVTFPLIFVEKIKILGENWVKQNKKANYKKKEKDNKPRRRSRRRNPLPREDGDKLLVHPNIS
jgi:hypothetical protein